MNRDEIAEAYEDLLAARLALYVAQRQHTHAQQVAAWQKWQAISEGKITGKNEAEREANLKMLLLPQYEEVEACEAALDGARCDWDMAQLELAALRATHARTDTTLRIDKSATTSNFYTVQMGDNVAEGLTWDEMLGQVAYMSCPKGDGWGPVGYFANSALSVPA